MFSALNEAVNKLMDGFFQQQEENRRLHKRCDELQTELRDMQARLLLEHEEFERRIEAVSSENLTLDHVLVGFRSWPGLDCQSSPVFLHKNVSISTLMSEIKGTGHSKLILDSLNSLKNSTVFDIWFWSDTLIVNKNDDIISSPYRPMSMETIGSYSQAKNLYKVCKELGIKVKVNGFESINGVPIDKILS
jgi:hypothetical protein